MFIKLLTLVGLYEPPKPKRVRHIHDLFCLCRKCNPSFNQYVKGVMKK